MNARLGPVWAAILALVLAVPAVAGQGIVTIYGVANNGGSPPTYTANVSSTSGITVGDHVMGKVSAQGATGVWLVTAKSSTTVTLQDSLTEETGTAFGPPLANVTNGLAYSTPEGLATMIPDGASWWGAAARRTFTVITAAAPTPAALTKTDDTNVTLTLGGSPSTALLGATSITVGWSGTLAVARGGTGAGDASGARTNLGLAIGTNVQAFDTDLETFAGITGTRGAVLLYGASGWTQLAPGTSGHAIVSNGPGADPSYQVVAPTAAALTRTDDTNVTLTLGGTPATALLQATSITAGWTGTLAEARGGTGAASITLGLDAAFGSTRGSILYRGAGGWVVLTPGTSGHALVSGGAGADPSYASVAQTLAQVLATGANGNSVDQTNLGSLTLAAGEVVTGPTILGSTAVVVGSADTSGARLDMETGTLAVREGDDSAYAPLRALSLTLSNALPASSGGTGMTSYTTGSTIYASGASTLVGLAPHATVGALYTSGGTGAGPAWVVGLPSATITAITAGVGAPTSLSGTPLGAVITNTGTTVKAACTLPAAVAGMRYTFQNVDSDGFRVVAASGDTIRLQHMVSATAGYVESVYTGSAFTLYAIDGTQWIASEVVGVWRNDSTTAAGFAFTETAWTAWTPTGTWSTNTTYSGFYRQSGNNLEGIVKITLAGAPTSANLRVDLPNSWTPNMTTLGSIAEGFSLVVGEAAILESGAQNILPSFVTIDTGFTDDLTICYSGSSHVGGYVTQALPVTFANNDTIRFKFSIPVN